MMTTTLPNSPESLQAKIESKQIPMRRVWWVLGVRSFFSFALLLLLALVFQLMGKGSPLKESAAYWLWFITLTNILCILLLYRFAQKEGLRLRDIFNYDPTTWKKDLLWLLIMIVGSALFMQFPGTALATLLWGDANLPNTMLIQPLPYWAIYPLFVLMPVTQALAELSTYWGYVAPRLRASGMNRWVTLLVVGFVLSLQHMFFSFQWDWRYNVWLALKFLPFALWTGFIVDRRPTALPYMMALHLLLDASLPLLVLMATNGSLMGM
jgi:hypothetical protein